MKKKFITLQFVFFLFILICGFTTKEKRPTIFMIGDSTMANKPIEGNNLERGWGQMLSGYLTDDILVRNFAINGRSSKSFIDEGVWNKVLAEIKPGDYVFIQFGHNDEKADSTRHTKPGSTFDDNLRKFVSESKAKGAIPVLLNSIVRRNFGTNTDSKTITGAVNQDDQMISANLDAKKEASANPPEEEGTTLIDTHGEYLNSPRNVAKELNVHFVDMNKITHDIVSNLGSRDSKKLYMWVAPNTIPAIPKGREDNTHLNVYGARLFAKKALEAVVEIVPSLSQYVIKTDFVVAKDGSGDFFTIQEAIDMVPDFRKNIRTTILIKEGNYYEKIIIPPSKLNVSLIGQGDVKLTYDDYASKKNILGDEKSTSGSSTCYVYSPDFYAENITFENTSGPVGQAVACFVDGDRAYFKNCRFLGYQDTLYTYGKNTRQYYENCYIEGTVDFIFGWATAVFDGCTIKSIGNGYVTAPSTDQNQKYGYVFYDCNLIANDDVNDVFLSRPWRPYAKAVYIDCRMGKHINPEGWNNWGKASNEKTVYYAEYNSKGEGAAPKKRASYSHQLKDTKGYEKETVLIGSDGWNPIKNGNTLVSIKR